MKYLAIALAALAGFASPAIAGGGGSKAEPPVIYVSCFRGPWKEVIWDRANPVFIDSLIKVGYDYPSAHAIGERICRDASLVDNPEGMKAEMIRVFNESPKYHNPRLRARSY